jgi:mRNA interferase MazF
MVNTYIPNRGDLIFLDFDPQKGHEESGRRPALVLSPEEYNAKTRLVIVCPITKQVKGYAFEVKLISQKKVEGVVLADHVKSFDWRKRNAQLIEKINIQSYQEVIAKLHVLLAEELD